MRSLDREIRLLDLLPGEGAAAIRCTTRIVALDSHPEFETVSYVWGDRNGEQSIEVSGTSIPVTRNLHAGLLRLRDSTAKRTLWIDQICINQWDLEEKAAQVALMRDIYRQCTRCVTWMGELVRDGSEVQVRDAEAVFTFLEQTAAATVTPLDGLPVLFLDSEEGEAAREAFRSFSMYGNPCAQNCDYTVAVPRLFAHVTRDLIRHEQGLRPLLGACEMPHASAATPSWAIDFARCNRIGKRQMTWWGHSHRYAVFSACGDHGLEELDTDPETLGLRGVYVDEVRATVALLRVDPQDAVDPGALREAIAACAQLLAQYRASGQAAAVYEDGFSWASAFCRTLVGDLLMDEMPVGRLASLGRERLQDASPKDLSHLDPKTLSTHLRESLTGSLENQTFFVTRTGRIGIGPAPTRRGDGVWVLSGGRVVFVLRGEGRGPRSAEPQRLTLVGDAYLHGCMDGEAVRAGAAWERVWIC
ncbi:heterokaryon incompatibility protein-domain-containing protein [Boeremia exigua]|uniref:heterokaryon incompatibility protein-domain-containing protein n=1 Tax=Boeremia exigua TaxID=749465 RepID=UPI001E8DE9B8|nr:heterokaryon incompatibility protein-domain-containing protein [Boeremia exigua]KAH6625880.1 heterokaryon incompatibility protein-domain-containing protein [Boeremia exigua]